jgi:hypothetical protein
MVFGAVEEEVAEVLEERKKEERNQKETYQINGRRKRGFGGFVFFRLTNASQLVPHSLSGTKE